MQNLIEQLTSRNITNMLVNGLPVNCYMFTRTHNGLTVYKKVFGNVMVEVYQKGVNCKYISATYTQNGITKELFI